MKKLTAVLLAIALLCTLAVSALALTGTEKGTITVTGIEADADVNAYKIIDVNFAGGTVKGYTWDTAVADWMAAQTTATWKSYTVKEMAADAAAYANFCSALSSAISSGQVSLQAIPMTTAGTDPDNNSYSATVGMGQYLVIVTGVSQYVYQPCTINLVPTQDSSGAWTLADSGKAHTKRKAIDIKKTITDSDGTDARDEDTAGVGDTVYFEITIDVPVNPADTETLLTYTDYMSSGLTYTEGSYAAYGKTGTTVSDTAFDTTELTWTDSTEREGCNQTERSWSYSAIRDYDQIVIRYSAALNSGAVVGTPEPNTAKVTYDEFHKEDTVKVYTYGLKILKKDGDTASPLAGAWFVVQENKGTDAAPNWVDIGAGHGSTVTVDTAVHAEINAAYNGNYYWASGTDGKINVTGLDAGDYRFIEVKAPDGYSLLAAPVTFTITAAKDVNDKLTGAIVSDPDAGTVGYYDSEVDDYAKIILPETGGIGTALFTVIGSVTMLAAGLILFTNRKKIFGK